MYISKIHIKNFKCFKDSFKLEFNDGINILVGDNESGKSTIIEAIHLTLTCLLNGRYLLNVICEYIFNNQVIDEYLLSLKNPDQDSTPPYILIEIFMEGDDLAEFEGNYNSERVTASGISLTISFDEKYLGEYEKLIKLGNIKTLPIEYYNLNWTTFAQNDSITTRSIPIKSALVDSASNKYQNGSDIYISHIVKGILEDEEIVRISQAHRKMKETFMDDPSIKLINEKIQTASKISDKKVELSVELSSKNAWENSLVTELDNVPFQYVGKGEQNLVKTKLALAHKKAKEANVILLEEPENHLSHTKLNQLLSELKDDNLEKQIIASTHNSFVANKLGLDNLIFLNEQKTTKLNELNPETKKFFEKLAGYDTLRLILCKKAILVEGDSDELIVQKAYMMKNNSKLPIQNGLDVISVGTSFLRFLEISDKLKKKTVVVTDNDGNIEALKTKYSNYLDTNAKGYIKICYDSAIDTGSDSLFNYNTLEPKLVKENGVSNMNTILGTTYSNIDDLHKYMNKHNTECALKVFEYDGEIKFPQYIIDAIE